MGLLEEASSASQTSDFSCMAEESHGEGGVDVNRFKAHSVRAAAPAHFTKIKALSLKQILARGGWKVSAEGSSRVFIKFYQRTALP